MKMADSCLQLDVGNSGAKWRLLRLGKEVSRGRYHPENTDSRQALLGCAEQLDQVWISSVASPAREADLTKLVQQRWGTLPWFARAQQQTGSLLNSYLDPERMGADRWLAMLAARSRLSSRFAVIDAGSALTIDIVAESGRHEGGYIIPGPGLMERALLLDTDRVRFDEDASYALAPGQSTAEAVRNGIAAAQAGAVKLVLERADIAPSCQLFCGGGARDLMTLLAITEGYEADLVFEGLEILALSAR
jgi:type III pantothenate kinase